MEPDNSIKVILFVAIFSALVCTPIAMVVDRLIINVLSAPTKLKRKSTFKFARNKSAGIAPRAWSSFASVAPVTETPVAVESSSRPSRRSSVKRRSVISSVFESLFGDNESEDEEESAAQLNAQSEMRTLVEQLAVYRTILTAEEKVEFDGECLG